MSVRFFRSCVEEYVKLRNHPVWVRVEELHTWPYTLVTEETDSSLPRTISRCKIISVAKLFPPVTRVRAHKEPSYNMIR